MSVVGTVHTLLILYDFFFNIFKLTLYYVDICYEYTTYLYTYICSYFHILGIVRNMLHNVFQMGFFVGQRVTIPI